MLGNGFIIRRFSRELASVTGDIASNIVPLSCEVEAVKVHDFVPRRDEVV
jgi:hypothetical protein